MDVPSSQVPISDEAGHGHELHEHDAAAGKGGHGVPAGQECESARDQLVRVLHAHQKGMDESDKKVQVHKYARGVLKEPEEPGPAVRQKGRHQRELGSFQPSFELLRHI